MFWPSSYSFNTPSSSLPQDPCSIFKSLCLACLDEDDDDDDDNEDDDDDDDEEETVQEAMAPSLVNVKNQLMKLVGSAFKFIGGSMVPKFTMQSTEKPEVSIDVTTSGNNVEATPKYNGMPDTMHK